MTQWFQQTALNVTFNDYVCDSTGQYVACTDSTGTLYVNNNWGYGAFTIEAPGAGSFAFTSLASSAKQPDINNPNIVVKLCVISSNTGSVRIAALDTSDNWSWSFANFFANGWKYVACDSTCTNILAVADGQDPRVSLNGTSGILGGLPSNPVYNCIAVSPDSLTFAVAIVGDANIYVSTGGAAFVPVIGATPGSNWTSLFIGDSVIYGNDSILACENGTVTTAQGTVGDIYVVNGGYTILGSGTLNWSSISASNDLVNIIASASGGGIFVSNNSGGGFTLQSGPPTSSNWSQVVSNIDGDTFAAISPNSLFTFGANCLMSGTKIKILDTSHIVNDQFYVKNVSELTGDKFKFLKQIEVPIENLKIGDFVVTTSNLGRMWEGIPGAEEKKDFFGMDNFFKFFNPNKPSNYKYYNVTQVTHIGYKEIKSSQSGLIRVLRKDKISPNVPSEDLYLLFPHCILLPELNHDVHYNVNNLNMRKYCKESYKTACEKKKGLCENDQELHYCNNGKIGDYHKIPAFKFGLCENIDRTEFIEKFGESNRYYNIVFNQCKEEPGIYANNTLVESCFLHWFLRGKFIQI